MILRYLLAAAAAYLIGSISTGVLISRYVFHDDVRQHGSGGTGATNMLRTYKLKAGVCTFAGDAVKAILAVAAGKLIAGFAGGCIAEVFVVVGHMWPLYFGFRGGKGIACTAGSVVLLYPPVLVGLLILWGIPVLLTRYISLGSVIAALGFVPLVWGWCSATGTDLALPIVTAVIIAALVLYAHRGNISRLIKGCENKI